ncbi:unnamed protein product [Pieris macdunnoughi]|uniref:THAP domain-containing protein 9 n=1 Tax=Pieris macdunnoughi TaxID=345717 RepID=A0A821XLM9_9NEOP|nr:unnamed protein product [Pieris macdunnoughi]
MACSNELIQNLINRVNDKKCGKVQSSCKYSEELRKFAITIHFYSPRAYYYLREKFDLCLPHVNTLRTWYARLDCEPGFTQESLITIKNMKERKPDLKLCLTFDEMSIREHTEWVGQRHYGFVNLGNDLAMDGAAIANQVLVFMVVALNSFWKIPVGYFPGRGFTASQKANPLKICLDLLHLTGCEVISITFDGIASNMNIAQLRCRFFFRT